MSVCFIIKKKILGIYSTGYLILVDLVDLNVGLKYATYPFKFIAWAIRKEYLTKLLYENRRFLQEGGIILNFIKLSRSDFLSLPFRRVKKKKENQLFMVLQHFIILSTNPWRL